ncbi:Cyclin-dependent kinase 20 [Gonioctena quinquepunctata]|nr:Cyclin-dependent kinase 20 [Gonioctena quinquepunctata]
MNNYKILGRAGEGAHGFVFKGLDLRDKSIVALKKITVNPNFGIPKNVMREMCVLRVLCYKNIVKLVEITCVGSSVVLVMEYLPWSLADVLKKTEIKLTLPQIKTYAKMVLNGVNFMHQNHIMHRDLKPANLLISKKGVLKIADFGLARIYDTKKSRLYSHQVATRWYRAPELLYGSKTYNLSVDMWSVGCIIAEMISGQPLFPGETDIEQLAIVLGTLGTPNEEVWPGLTQLPDYNKIAFSHSFPKSWSIILPTADEASLQLISKILIYDENKRLNAKK